MANLSANVQQYGTNITGSPFSLSESVFAVGTTTVFVLNNSGSFISWQNDRAAFLNTLTAIPAFTAFQVRPGGSITTNDSILSFGTLIPTGSGTGLTGFNSGFGA